MKKIISILSFLTLFTTSCTTLEGVANSRGSGTKAEFNKPYDQVFEAAEDSVRSLSLSLAGRDKNKGQILAHSPLNLMTAGENVAIWITRNGSNSTTVEVISKRKTYASILTINWEQRVIQQIHRNLD